LWRIMATDHSVLHSTCTTAAGREVNVGHAGQDAQITFVCFAGGAIADDMT
jgi:hypothetical protein